MRFVANLRRLMKYLVFGSEKTFVVSKVFFILHGRNLRLMIK